MDIDDLILSMGQARKDGFETLAPQAITNATLHLLRTKDAVSLDDVLAILREWGAAAKTTEPARIAINAAIQYVETLRRPAPEG